jgi:hypothetical protein
MLRPLCARWAYASGTDLHAEHTRQELMCMLSIRVWNWCACWAFASGTDVHAEHSRQELMCMLSIRVRNWCKPSAYASVPFAHAHQFTLNIILSITDLLLFWPLIQQAFFFTDLLPPLLLWWPLTPRPTVPYISCSVFWPLSVYI